MSRFKNKKHLELKKLAVVGVCPGPLLRLKKYLLVTHN